MLCTSPLSQGTGKTLWKTPKDGLVHLKRSLGRIQRPDTCPTYFPQGACHAWKPTGTHASTINFHSAHPEKTGRLTTGMGRTPIAACSWLFPPPFKVAALFPCSALTLLLLPPSCRHRLFSALAPPSCSTRHQLTKEAEETLSYFLPDCFSAQQGSWKRVWGAPAEGKLWEQEGGENGNSSSAAGCKTAQRMLLSHTWSFGENVAATWIIFANNNPKTKPKNPTECHWWGKRLGVCCVASVNHRCPQASQPHSPPLPEGRQTHKNISERHFLISCHFTE